MTARTFPHFAVERARTDGSRLRDYCSLYKATKRDVALAVIGFYHCCRPKPPIPLDSSTKVIHTLASREDAIFLDDWQCRRSMHYNTSLNLTNHVAGTGKLKIYLKQIITGKDPCMGEYRILLLDHPLLISIYLFCFPRCFRMCKITTKNK